MLIEVTQTSFNYYRFLLQFICQIFHAIDLSSLQKNQELQLMEGTIQSDSSHHTNLFTKGMTLSDYMANLSLQDEWEGDQTPQEKQQNLFQELQKKDYEMLRGGRERFSIKEVDEESVEESMDGPADEMGKKYANEQLTKETFRQSNFFMEHTPARVQHPMNATAYFNHSNEKNSFRVKHLSNSPYKKKTEGPPQGVPMTLYGRKFAQSIGKEGRVPQLATFYGKMKEKTEQRVREVKEKASKPKPNFRKKGQLQLEELIKFEQRIKSNFSQKIYFQDIRIQGIRDKICERKNKLY